MAKPTKENKPMIIERNKKVIAMRKSGYPLSYIANLYNLSKSQVSRLYKAYCKQYNEDTNVNK